MDSPFCDECRAIEREFRRAAREAAEHGSDRSPEARSIDAWLELLNLEDCARMRESSSLWKTWRRLQRHRILTGHSPSVLPMPPAAISNPN